jgi:hypothetical protein
MGAWPGAYGPGASAASSTVVVVARVPHAHPYPYIRPQLYPHHVTLNTHMPHICEIREFRAEKSRESE